MITLYYYRYNSFVVLLMSVFLFLTFQNLKLNNEKVQNVIRIAAPLTMGVYLIHDNVHARQIVWQGIHGLNPDMAAPFIVVGYSLAIFIICLIIEKIRTLLFLLIEKRELYKSLLQKIDHLPANTLKIIESNY